MVASQAAVLSLLLAVNCFGQTRYILEAHPADLSGILSRHGLILDQTLRTGASGFYKVEAPMAVDPTKLDAEMEKDKAVIEFESDSEVESPESGSRAVITPSLDALSTTILNQDVMPYYGSTVKSGYVNQPATGLIELAPALAQFAPGNTIVAVIDTGIDPNLPALHGVLVNGYDFTRDLPGTASELADLDQSTVAILDQSTVAILDRKNTPVVLNQSTVAILDQSTVAILDPLKLPSAFGHGTMVSGLIHLVAPGARIMPLKAFHADGTSNISDVIRAVYYAVDNGAKVINMSFSTTVTSSTLSSAIAYAASHGVICVASAGNDGQRELVYPAGLSGVIGVGSTNSHDKRSPFSNYGTRSSQTAAPGEAVITLYPGNNYAGVWGTSFSTALVSGAMALLLNLNPHVETGDLGDWLEHGKPIDMDMGDSRLDVLSMLTYLKTRRAD
jgi:subtilisin family serine protease